MKELRPVDRRLFFELMKNSRRSDRELSRVLGLSQPTVSRKRASLEKELVEAYTLIPNWAKLGYSLMAITLVKVRVDNPGSHDARFQEVLRRGSEWLIGHPNVLMAGGCRGMGVESFMISVHKTYVDFDEFMGECRLKLGDLLEIVQFFLVNLAGRELLKPFNPAYIAEGETKQLHG